MIEKYIQEHYDRKDDMHACFVRQRLGEQGKLVSWERREDGSWLARLSCSEIPVTVARSGKSRIQAIRNANNALYFLLGQELEV